MRNRSSADHSDSKLIDCLIDDVAKSRVHCFGRADRRAQNDSLPKGMCRNCCNKKRRPVHKIQSLIS
jgi:hypothetical protein